MVFSSTGTCGILRLARFDGPGLVLHVSSSYKLNRLIHLRARACNLRTIAIPSDCTFDRNYFISISIIIRIMCDVQFVHVQFSHLSYTI